MKQNKLRLIIESLTAENTNLKTEIAKLKQGLPTDTQTRKRAFIDHALAKLEVIHTSKKKKESSCKGA